jgi:hypothetical protein
MLCSKSFRPLCAVADAPSCGARIPKHTLLKLRSGFRFRLLADIRAERLSSSPMRRSRAEYIEAAIGNLRLFFALLLGQNGPLLPYSPVSICSYSPSSRVTFSFADQPASGMPRPRVTRTARCPGRSATLPRWTERLPFPELASSSKRAVTAVVLSPRRYCEQSAKQSHARCLVLHQRGRGNDPLRARTRLPASLRSRPDGRPPPARYPRPCS